MKNIYVLGDGFISSHLKYPKIIDRITASQDQINYIIERYKPDVLINTIGFCGNPNIDQCEKDKEKTIISNTVIPTLLAHSCLKRDIKFINISSGCIFFGKSKNLQYISQNYAGQWNENNTFYTPNQMTIEADHGWKENDFANPQSYYTKSKYSCDLNIGDLKNTTVLRIRMPISNIDSPRNLINKLKKYDKIIDIQNSMTIVSDLVRCIDWVIEKELAGIFHCTNPQTLSAVDIMKEYQKYIPNHKFSIITENELDNIVSIKRSNCILNCEKLYNTGFYMPLIKDRIKEIMKEYIDNLRR